MKLDSHSSAIILVWGEKALVQLRDKKEDIAYPGFWALPGGRIEEGESAKKAATRELKEESGYICKNPKPFLTEIYPLDGKLIKRHIFVEKYDGRQKIECFEGQKMEFKSPEELRYQKVYEGHLELIKKALEFVKYLND